MNKRRLFAALCVLVLVMSTLPLAAISFYNHPYYDDYGFSAGVHQAWKETGSLGAVWSAAIESARNTRLTWQGTYTGTFLSNLQPGLFSESLYWTSNLFMLAALIVCVGFFFGTVFEQLGLERPERVSLSALALTVMIQFMPDPGEAFYWFNGGVGNTFVYSLLALAAALIVRLLADEGRATGKTAALFVLAVLLGGGSYGGGLFALCMGVCLLCWLFWKKQPKRWHVLAVFIVFAACFAYSITAPGNTVRAGKIGYESSAVKTVLLSLYYGVAQMGRYVRLPLAAVTLLMLPALYRAAKRSALRFSHPWLALGVGMCLYCTQFAPPLHSIASIGAGRIVNTYFISFVIGWFLYVYYLLGVAARRLNVPEDVFTPKRMKALLLVSMCLLGTGCLAWKRPGDVLYGVQNLSGASAALSIVTGEAAQYDREMKAREEQLNDDAKPVVTLAPLTAVPDVLMDDLLQEDAVYDVRPSLCLYYGKDSILLPGEEVQP